MEDSLSSPSANTGDDAADGTKDNKVTSAGDSNNSNNDSTVKTEGTAFEDSVEISTHENASGDSDGSDIGQHRQQSDNEKVAFNTDPSVVVTPTMTESSQPTTTTAEVPAPDKVTEESKKEVEDGETSSLVNEANEEGKQEEALGDRQQSSENQQQPSETGAVPGAFACSNPPSLVKGSATMMDTNSATDASNQPTTASTGSLLNDNEEENAGYIRRHASVMKPMEEGERCRKPAQQPGAIAVTPISNSRQSQQQERGNTTATSSAAAVAEQQSSPKPQRQELVSFETEITRKLPTSPIGERGSIPGSRSQHEQSSPKPQRQELVAFESEITSKLTTSPIGTTSAITTSRAELESFSDEIAAKSRPSATEPSKSQSTINSTYNYSSTRRITPGAVYIPPDEDELMLAAALHEDNNGSNNSNPNSTNQSRNAINGTGQQDPHRQQSSRVSLRASMRDSKRFSQGTIAAIPLESWNILEEEERVKELEERASKLQYELDNAPRAEVVGSTTEFHPSSLHLIREASSHAGGDLSERSEAQTKQPLWWKWVFVAVSILIIVVIVVAVVLSKSSTSSAKPMDVVGEVDATKTPTMSPTGFSPESLPPTLQRIQERGFVKCRGSPDEVDSGVGFSVDMVCRSCHITSIAGFSNLFGFSHSMLYFFSQSSVLLLQPQC